jgi:hypothetical protein
MQLLLKKTTRPMNKLTTTLFFICVMAFGSAQSQIVPRMGIKAGLNSANISGIEATGINNFHAGIFLNMKLVFVGLQAEALYSRMGAELQSGTIGNDYLQFPIVAKLFIIPGLLNLQGGVQYSLLVNSVFAGNDIKTSFSNGDWGVPIGLELELLNRLQVTGRYIFGLSDIKGADASNIPGVGSEQLNNQLFQLSLGWKFGGK